MRTLLAVLLLLAACLGASAAEERILSFDSAVRVMPDASLDVTETIRVDVLGIVIRRGIIRDFPTRYVDRHGRVVTAGFSVVSVQRDGRDEPYAVESIDNGKRIRIGNKDVLLEHRPTTYAIRYRATRELGFFDGFDELYWNVTGNGWTFPIDAASVTVDLPSGAAILRSAGYTGPQGAQGRDFTVLPAPAGRFAARTTRPLSAGEGFTVAVAFPKGVVRPPGGAEKAWWFLQDNAAAIVAWLGLVGIGLFYYRAWSRVGRDPAAGVIVPLFRPPDGLTPAAARYVREQGFDDKAFASAVIGLAVKGHLNIVDGSAGYRFEPQAKDVAGLSAGERGLLAALGPQPVDVVDSNHEKIGGARKALSRVLDNEYRGVAFVLNRGWFWGGAALSLAVLALAFALASGETSAALAAAGFTAVWWGVIALAGRRGWTAFSAGRGFSRLGGLFLLLFLIPFACAGLLFPIGAVLQGWLPLDLMEVVIAAILLVALNVAFFFLLTAPTPSGRVLLDKIEGFRLYLATTEEDRLAVLNPPERTPELFERYLPYALALGCAHQWSSMFTQVLAMAGVSAPAWYSGSNWDAGRPARFADGLGSGLATSTAAASSPPGSSSGSDGGGSSGGGGGGGGGSGW